jgi:STAM-binding protein
VLGNLAAHPEANQPEHRLAFAHAERDVQNDLAKLEILKPRIKKRFERYEQLVKDRVTGISLEPVRGSGLANDENHTQGPHKRWRPVSDVAVIDTSEALVADDSQELAVRLAEKEIRRRATARKATLQAGTSQEAEQGHGKAGLWGSLEDVPAPESYDIDGNTLSQRMQDINLQLGATKSKEGNSVSSRLSNQGLGTSYSYPKVPETKTLYAQKQDIRNSAPATPITRNDVRTPAQSPTPPPKDHIASPRGDEPRGTGRYDHSTPDDAPQLHATSPVRTDFKPANFVFRPSAYLENGSPLRTVFLPPELRHRFLSIAQENTRANLETCGILCGTLISNALFISKLVIPDQESTSDTCETVNESELFDYVDGEDLMVLGWIHTHPTQTCFMSSRDLHTHCGYQVMMPESIAVVCAPSKGE